MSDEKEILLLILHNSGSSDHQKVQAVLPKIRDHVRQHCETLNLSAKVAENGWSMADNAVTVFQELVNDKASPEDIQEAISLLSESSGQINESVGNVLTAIRSDRTQLLSVCFALGSLLLLEYVY